MIVTTGPGAFAEGYEVDDVVFHFEDGGAPSVNNGDAGRPTRSILRQSARKYYEPVPVIDDVIDYIH